MDYIQRIISEIPPAISFEGIDFELQIIHNYNELRLGYFPLYVEPESKHFADYKHNSCWLNPLIDISGGGHYCSFLYLYERIVDDVSMMAAIDNCVSFLKKHSLIKKEQ